MQHHHPPGECLLLEHGSHQVGRVQLRVVRVHAAQRRVVSVAVQDGQHPLRHPTVPWTEPAGRSLTPKRAEYRVNLYKLSLELLRGMSVSRFVSHQVIAHLMTLIGNIVQ